MKALFVLNPDAGRGKARRLRESILREFADCDEAAEAGEPGAIVIAAGGDGTVHRVLNGLAGRGVRIGILPCGRANDFARSIGIPRDLREACRVIRRGEWRRIDLASVNGDLFATTGGLGLIASISARADRWRRGGGVIGKAAGLLGRLGYPLASMIEICGGWEPVEAEIAFAGSRLKGTFAAIIVSKQPRFGGWFRSSPEASGEDGLIHLCAIASPPTRRRMLAIAWEILMGRPGRCAEIARADVRSLTITTASDADFFADGELMRRDRRFRVEVVPGGALVAAEGGRWTRAS